MNHEIELFSIPAEQSVLGALMLDGDAIDHIATGKFVDEHARGPHRADGV